MDKPLADLIRISNAVGKDKALVQGGGGNASVKTADGKYMYIKASGTVLKDMNARQGWRRLRLEPVLAIIKDVSVAKLDPDKREPEVVNRLFLACEDNVTSGARPSVESHLHGCLERCVIHLHSTVVGAYVNAKNGRAELEKLFAKENKPPLWVPYTDPGFMLAKRIAGLVGSYQEQYGCKPTVMILEKHGLFVTAKTADGVLRLVRKVIRLCKSRLKEPKASKRKAPSVTDVTAAKLAIRRAVFKVTGQYLPVSYFGASKAVAAFMRRKDAAKLLATPALSPDELVYANGSAMWVPKCDAKTISSKLAAQLCKGQKPAAAFVVKGLGLFIAADKKMSTVIAEITESSLLIRTWAAGFGGVLALNKRQQDFINNWESESFRKKLASGAGTSNECDCPANPGTIPTVK